MNEKIGRVSSASVLKATGKNWNQWIKILKEVGAEVWTHKEIVAYLKKHHKLGPWWQQGVASGFEVSIGRKLEGRNAKGEWTVTATKSIHANHKKIWRFIISSSGIQIWLNPLGEIKIKAKSTFETRDGYFGEIRTVKAPQRIRLHWQDPDWEKKSVVQVNVYPKRENYTILVFQHEQITEARIQAKIRMRWREVLDTLADHIPT